MKKKIFVLFAIFMGVILMSGCSIKVPKSNNTAVENTVNESTEKETANLSKNITSEGALTQRGKLVVIAKNNNKETVSLNVEVEFYDSSKTLVKSGKESLTAVGPGSTIAVEIYDTPDNFDSYKIYTDAEKVTYVKSYLDKIEISHNKTDEVVAQVKNNSDDTISYVEATIVFYQGDKVVGFDDGIESDVKPGRSANFNFYNPYNNNYDDVRYDNYKIFVNGAYSYAY